MIVGEPAQRPPKGGCVTWMTEQGGVKLQGSEAPGIASRVIMVGICASTARRAVRDVDDWTRRREAPGVGSSRDRKQSDFGGDLRKHRPKGGA